MRFEVVHSNVVKNGWFIKDNVGTLTFPTSTNLNDLFCYCRVLNKLYSKKEVFNMDDEIKKLLKDIKLELDGLNRYKAFNAYYGGMGYYEVLDCDVIDLNFKDLIKRIDEVILDE